MTASVLDCISLSYQTLWGRQRSLVGIAVFVAPLPEPPLPGPIDAQELLEALGDRLPADGPPLFLVPQSQGLLLDLLAVIDPPAPPGAPGPRFATRTLAAPTLVVPDFLLQASSLAANGIRLARQRGLRLVWRGSADAPPPPELRDNFHRYWLDLPAPWAAAALKDATRKASVGQQIGPGRLPPGHIYGGIESRVLMEYCLDRCKALALAGWPAEDVVYSLRHQAMQPSHAVVMAALKALEGDRSAEVVQRTLSEDPLLVYRFLIYANSPALGLRAPIESIRHGMMMLGIDTIRSWLGQQVPFASRETALRPVNAQLVLRARLMENLLDAGIEEALRREVSLCGLFSGLDLLLNEPAGVLLPRIRLSRRVQDAVIQHDGPYGPSLAVTLALEKDDPLAVQALCATHEMEPGRVNRALLDVLGDIDVDGPTI
ncbi:HDOD domain-containing protein [Xylophilus rhododendri]|uniref:HDOD domain-containing protein n=1 Tax=Xylophilus rhododendri TaxID=2697032 RepID=A0A857J4N1_9BURK|nr:HDOD domain-containing protein [Xylophilus rhododendri]QHI97992.1 HDOD domain-containing protein [Xylophilus rhododendri]